LCGVDVPCGKYADQMLQNAHVTIPTSKITRGEDVKATLAAVTTGDADAAIVYTTDALSAGNAVTTVEIPDSQNVIASYPIAVIPKSGNTATAQAFAAYFPTPAGEATLKSFGFLPPSCPAGHDASTQRRSMARVGSRGGHGRVHRPAAHRARAARA